jgi:Mn2+/Fe2+ NRAMP family transporter
MIRSRLTAALGIIGPGILVAATGVGAGDLATASFAGSQLGTAVLWAVVVGGVFKFVLTEGLARWQLATGKTFIEGAVAHLGPAVGWVFVPYLLLWSYFVGAALMGACGVALHALIPVFDDASMGKVVFGILSSIVGLALVRWGDFRLFERIMGLCIGLMFLTVVVMALRVWPGSSAVVSGLFRPSIPDFSGGGLSWTVALIGGVGGTVTILCYGYWIREKGRDGADQLGICRLDLAVGYVATVIFGIAMVIIGSTVSIEGRGADLLVRLADALGDEVGTTGRWLFLIGALGAVFSSLLGVWQAVPYIFSDVWGRLAGAPEKNLAKSRRYRLFQLGIATFPMLGLVTSFRQAQFLYAFTGAAFLPLLAAALLILNGRKSLVGALTNGWGAVATLGTTLLFFAWVAGKFWLGG